MKRSKSVSILSSVFLAILILSGSIAVVILCRPFYYAHIHYLDLPSEAGISAAQIKEAYNQVLDYCIGLSAHFSAGVFAFSENGVQHFRDVRILFQLNLLLLALSILILTILHWFCKKHKITPYRFFGFGPLGGTSIFILSAFTIIGVLSSLHFDLAFTLFHKIFFPGKDNWILSYTADPIINVLPQIFFRNCAILILGIIVIVCSVFIYVDIRQRRKSLV